MSTWNGVPKKFIVDFYNPNNIWDIDSGGVEFSWSYQTTADVLTIKTSHPNMKNGGTTECMGPDWGEAMLYTLASWYYAYNSRDQLRELLKDFLEDLDNPRK